MANPHAGPDQPPPAATRRRGAPGILAAAAALFAERGYAGVPVSAIAARAGVSKANIFHHFKTKDRLYLAVLRQACAASSQILHDGMRGTDPFAERLRHAARGYLHHLLEQEDLSRLILREVMEGGSRRAQELAEQVFDENFSGLVQMLREGQQSGALRADTDPAMAAVLLLGANVFFFLARGVLIHLKDARFATDPTRYSELLIDYLLNGITAPAAAGPAPRN
ncbi:MAG: hypothetical protein B7Z66_14625 [Chromatiales bacterium 21-64-14]|nr:MAG: hypothetical protein B7Z66_14625 [Chromatiales bacterium 21-64-14]HQU17284.1 TetR/AcrR family transcriptional regulator [Gammaproteobacteria bacterium]